MSAATTCAYPMSATRVNPIAPTTITYEGVRGPGANRSRARKPIITTSINGYRMFTASVAVMPFTR